MHSKRGYRFRKISIPLSFPVRTEPQNDIAKLGANEVELLRIVQEMKLPVIVASKDDKADIVQIVQNYNFGACGYLLKPIPKKNNEGAQLQQLKNDVSRGKIRRMSWALDFHSKFVKCVQELGGAKSATPRKILQLLQSKFKGFEDVNREQVSSHLQKYRDKLGKKRSETNLPTIGGSTSCGNQSNALMTQMDEAFSSELMQNEFTGGQPVVYKSFLNYIDASTNDIFGDPCFVSINAPDLSPLQSVTLPFETNLPTIGGSTSCGNQSNALMTQMDEAFSSEQMPFVTLPFETNLPTIGGSTGCGNQSNALMIQMDEAFSSEQMPFVTLPFETNLPTIGGSTNCGNQSNFMMIQMAEAFSSEQMPFVTLPFQTNLPTIGGSTSCGNQSNALMTQMWNEFTGGQSFDYKSLLNDLDEFSCLDTFQGGISGDPGLYFNNAPLRSPFHTDHGEHVCSQDGIAENSKLYWGSYCT